MYTDDKLDNLIKDTVREMVESTTPPPVEDSWKRFEEKYRQGQATKHKQQVKKYKNLLSSKSIIAVAIIMIIVIFISFPVNARAIGERLVNTITILLSDTHINVGTIYSHREPEPIQQIIINELPIGEEVVATLEEVRLLTPYSIAIPNYIPDGYEFEELLFQELIQPLEVVKVTLKYTGPNSSYFQIQQKNVPIEYGSGQGYDIDDTIKQEFSAGQNKGIIYVFNNGKIKATWVKQGIVFVLEGMIQKEDALRIVESI